MKNFEFHNPTKLVFGSGEFARLGEIVAKYGKRALVLKGSKTLEKLGVYDTAEKNLKAAGVEVFTLSGVEANPKLSKVEEGVKIAKENNVDVIVPIGGGSTIDCGKSVAYGFFDDGDIWDFFTIKRVATKSLPVITVCTVAATGSEMNTNSVITNDRDADPINWAKWSTHYAHSYPKESIIDPELQTSVSIKHTAAGMYDIFSHVMELYFDDRFDTPLNDRLAEGIMITVMENENVLEDPANVDIRANLAWCSILALNGINDCGRSGGNYDAHTIEHEIGAMTDCSHGEGLSVCHTAWLYHKNELDCRKFVRFTKRVFGFVQEPAESDLDFGKRGIDALKAKSIDWNLAVTLKELGMKKEWLNKAVDEILKNPEGKDLDKESVMDILLACYE